MVWEGGRWHPSDIMSPTPPAHKHFPPKRPVKPVKPVKSVGRGPGQVVVWSGGGGLELTRWLKKPLGGGGIQPLRGFIGPEWHSNQKKKKHKLVCFRGGVVLT